MKYIEKYRLILGKDQKRKVIAFLFSIFVNGIMELLSVSFMLPLVLTFLDSEAMAGLGFLTRFLPAELVQDNKRLTLILLTVFFGIIVVKNICIYVSKSFRRKFTVSSCFQTSARLFNIYLHCDYEDFIRHNSQELIGNIVNVVNKVYLLLAAFLNLLAELAVSFLLLILLLIVNWKITMILAVLLTILLLLYRRWSGEKLEGIGKRSNEVYDKAIGSVQEAVGGFKEIKLLNREKHFYDEFCKNYRENVTLECRRSFYEYAPMHVTEVVIFFALCLYLGLSVAGNADNSRLIAEIAAISFAAVRMIPSMNRINGNLNLVNLYKPSLNDISEEFLRYMKDPGLYEFRDCPQMPFRESIELRNISFRYQDTSVNILENANIMIRKGQKIGIQGISGGGKTTMVDVILGYLKPESGEVLVDGTDIRNDITGWMKNIGYIPQTIFLLDGSIRDNILFGCEEKDETKIWNVLRQAQMEDFVKSLEQGLDTQVGERGIRLSGGQRQRLGIARALYNKSELLVLDEATSALDKETEKELMDVIFSLDRDKTMLIIAHNINTLTGCDEIYTVQDKSVRKVQ